MIVRSIRRIIVSVLCSALLVACASRGNLKADGKLLDPAQLQSSATFSGAAIDNAGWPTTQWWATLGDSQLDMLMNEAFDKSPSLAAAQARIQQARALAESRGADSKPDVAGKFKVGRQRLSENGFFPPPFAGSKFTQYDLGVEVGYDFDFWGRNRAALRAALDAQHVAEVDIYAARLALAADIVRSYIQLDRAYALKDVAQATLDQRKSLLELTRQRVSAGLDTQLELRQSDAALPQSEGDLVRLGEQIDMLGHQLAALAGQGPDRGQQLTRPHIDATRLAALPTVVPADLVGRRPDVVAQRWRVEAAGQDIKSSEAAFYPNINLAAIVRLESLRVSDLLDYSSHDYNIGPAIRLPIFDGGRLRAQLRGSNASYDLAVADYNNTVVGALREVADAVTTLSSIETERAAVDRAITALQGAYDIAVLRYRAGLSSYLNVLVAEGQVLQQKQLKADIDARRMDASISLIHALGGGFDDAGFIAQAALPESHAH
jgi:NodT family efflux transporter outer membrane factor (OMF) lipoprotein